MTQHSTWLAAALAVTLTPALATAETVKVGVVLTYSGGGARLAQQIDRAMDLYMEQEGNARLGEHEIELIKRDAKNPGGDTAKVAVQELIVREDVDLLTGFIYSPNIIASAPLIEQAKVPTLIMNAATAWIPNLSPHLARVSMSMWQTGFPMGRYAAETLGCATAAVGYTDYPPGKIRSRHSRWGSSGRSGGRRHPHGRAGRGARLHAVHAAGQGRAAGLLLRLRARRQPRGRGVQDLRRPRHARGRRADRPGRHHSGHRAAGPGRRRDRRGHARAVQADLDVGTNRAFVEAWKAKIRPDSTPDFMAAAGYDGMAAIVDAIVEQGKEIDPDRTMEIWSGWTHEGPRGHVMIDPETRDIVQDMQVNEVYAEDGRLKMRTIDVIPQVKDRARSRRSAAAPMMSRPSAPADARSAGWPFGAAQESERLPQHNRARLVSPPRRDVEPRLVGIYLARSTLPVSVTQCPCDPTDPPLPPDGGARTPTVAWTIQKCR